ncbi:GroES-like protein [Durotheca rogersii]|uniref:GroES-like protein n=1 Tax=Durotheca rogersii TaxID=419775 RepID=UPI002220FF92|nr:GroES-like protein [Durotheca rogersii]KAI5855063.1 GroES-like protein [Durotheca rogersii]
MSIQQYQAIKQGGPFKLVTATAPKPGPHEVTIRPKALSLNAIDWKNFRFGATVPGWPTVLGIEGSGVVESVGDGVTSFKPGDEVMNWIQRTQYNGTFQEVYTARDVVVAKKPANLSFEEAASLPIAFLTAAAGVAVGLKVPLPGLPGTEAINPAPKSILVIGGSSGVGSGAIQLLRLALPSATIITTSSVAHHAHLKSLGANTCLERAAQEDSAALKAAAPGGAGVDAILDAVGAAADSPAIYDAFKSDGPKLYALVLTRPGVQLPDGLQSTLVGGQNIIDKNPAAMEYLTKLLAEGKYKLPLKVEVVGKGFEAIEKGLDRIPQNSGKKLVISL